MVRTNNLLSAAAIFASSAIAQSNENSGIVLDAVLTSGNSAAFDLSIPVSLGPWEAVGVEVNWNQAEAAANGFTGNFDTDSIPTYANSTFKVSASDNTDLGLGFNLNQAADFVGEVVVTAVVDITKDLVIAKRDDVKYTLIATATSPASSGSASGSASASSSASGSPSGSVTSTGSSTATGGALSTSTATESDIKTTVVTITSCHEDACHLTAVTTGYVVLTTTKHSEVTSYTTYCPLPSTTKCTECTKTEGTDTTTTATIECTECTTIEGTTTTTTGTTTKSKGTDATEGTTTTTKAGKGSTVSTQGDVTETVKVTKTSTTSGATGTATTSSQEIPTYEGAANKAIVGAALALPALLLL